MKNEYINLIIIIAVIIGVVALCREFFCWYFKITEISNHLSKISDGIFSLRNTLNLNYENETIDISDSKKKDVSENNNTLDKNSKSLNANLSDNQIEELKKLIKQTLHEEKQYSLNTIYDEDNLIGHEWNQFVSEGHWVKMIYDEKREKFISVKHYRTDKNLEKNGKDSRIKEELNYNIEQVFGNLDEKGRKKNKHVPFSKKIKMRN